jgi:hypothetical protein
MTNINWLMLFKEIIAVYSENQSPYTKYRVTDYQVAETYSYQYALAKMFYIL